MRFPHIPVTDLPDATRNFETLQANPAVNLTSPFINVQAPQYGATGNNIADDTAAVQKAQAALGPNGGTLFFPPGKYKLATDLNFDDTRSVKLLGAGGMSAGAQTASWLNFTGTTAHLSARSTTGFTVEDLAVQQSNGTFAGKLIDLSPSASLTASAYANVHRCAVFGPQTAACLLNLETVISSTFVNSYFNGAITNVNGSTSVGQSNAFAFTGCTFANAATNAVLNLRQGWAFTGCTFENLHGGGVGGIVGPAEGVAVLGCWFGDGTGGIAMDFTGGSGCFVAGCNIGAFTGTGIRLASGYVGATIVGNKFQSETVGVQFVDTGSRCLIAGNDFVGAATPVAFTTMPTSSMIDGTTTGFNADLTGSVNVGTPNIRTGGVGTLRAQTSLSVNPTDANHWLGSLTASGVGAGSFLKIQCGDDLAQRGIQVGGGNLTKLGFLGTTPVAQPARAVTLADVIAVLAGYGLTA